MVIEDKDDRVTTVIPSSQKEHDALKNRGYGHKTSDHWMFRGDEPPKYVTSGEEHERLKAQTPPWENYVMLYKKGGRDFHKVTNLEHFRRCHKMGYYARNKPARSESAASSGHVV